MDISSVIVEIARHAAVAWSMTAAPSLAGTRGPDGSFCSGTPHEADSSDDTSAGMTAARAALIRRRPAEVISCRAFVLRT
jgi:hypothetical protein